MAYCSASSLILTCMITISLAGFHYGSPAMSLPSYVGHVSGTYNGSIFLIGGVEIIHKGKQITEYNTNSNSFSNHYPSGKFNTYSTSQATQKDEILYMIPYPRTNDNYDTIGAFNMITKQSDSYWNNITLQRKVGEVSCLASSTDYLFVISGRSPNYHNEFQVLRFSNLTWFDNTPPLNYGVRASGACVVQQGQLYAFGGTSATATVEYIPVHNFAQHSWTYTADELSDRSIFTRAVAADPDLIYIMLGSNGNLKLNTVNIMNVTSGKIILSPTTLLLRVIKVAAAYVDPILYIFGGEMSGFINDWMYWYTIPSQSPTLYPSASPTRSPSFHPSVTTIQPTNSPTAITFAPTSPTYTPTLYTMDPSNDPTFNPTHDPTSLPTNIPSTQPSAIPTADPTADPTFVPTTVPTDEPTYDPTVLPTFVPTQVPTVVPTNNPTSDQSVNTKEEEEEAASESDEMSEVMMYVVISIVLWMLAAGCFINWWKNKNRVADQDETNLNDINFQPGAIEPGS